MSPYRVYKVMDKLDWKIRRFLVDAGYLFSQTDAEIERALKEVEMLEHDNAPAMSAEPGVIKEAERLFAKFGSQSAEVAKELKKVDSSIEHFFWDLVVAYLNDMRRANAK